VRWENKQPFDGQLCLEYVYQKFLKLDNSSSTYGEKKFGVFFMPHRVNRAKFNEQKLYTVQQ